MDLKVLQCNLSTEKKIKEDNNVREVEVTVKENVEKANVFEFYLRNIKDIFTGNI